MSVGVPQQLPPLLAPGNAGQSLGFLTLTGSDGKAWPTTTLLVICEAIHQSVQGSRVPVDIIPPSFHVLVTQRMLRGIPPGTADPAAAAAAAAVPSPADCQTLFHRVVDLICSSQGSPPGLKEQCAADLRIAGKLAVETLLRQRQQELVIQIEQRDLYMQHLHLSLQSIQHHVSSAASTSASQQQQQAQPPQPRVHQLQQQPQQQNQPQQLYPPQQPMVKQEDPGQ